MSETRVLYSRTMDSSRIRKRTTAQSPTSKKTIEQKSIEVKDTESSKADNGKPRDIEIRRNSGKDSRKDNGQVNGTPLLNKYEPPSTKPTEEKLQFHALTIILILLPVATAIVMGESAGLFVTDTLILCAIGWLMWTITEGTWRLYVNNQSRYEEQIMLHQLSNEMNVSPTDFLVLQLSMILQLVSPSLCGGILYYSRENLTNGPRLVSNFSIFLYIVLESARGINRLVNNKANFQKRLNQQQMIQICNANNAKAETESVVHQELSQLKQSYAIMESNHERLSQVLDFELQVIHQQLVEVGNRLEDNETTLSTELFAAWKGIDRLTKALKMISLDQSSSSPRLKHNEIAYKQRKLDVKNLQQYQLKKLGGITTDLETVPEDENSDKNSIDDSQTRDSAKTYIGNSSTQKIESQLNTYYGRIKDLIHYLLKFRIIRLYFFIPLFFLRILRQMIYRHQAH